MSLKFNIIRIIKEELDRWFDDEPTLLDRYYEKKFGVSKPQVQPQPEQIDGELVGYLDKSWEQKLDIPIPVYKNPKTLKGFETSARGVLLANGDFFLGKTSNAMHWNILQLLVKLGYIANDVSIASYGTTEPEEFITVIRVYNSNYFSQSEAYDEFPIYYQIMFDEANKKHSYKFKHLGAND
jgi:hypothetical protein